MKAKEPHLRPLFLNLLLGLSFIIILVLGIIYAIRSASILGNKEYEKAQVNSQLVLTKQDLTLLQNQDQYVINQKLKKDVVTIETDYQKAVETYEKLLALKDLAKNTDPQDKMFANALSFLSKFNYASAEAELSDLNNSITTETNKITASFAPPANTVASNSPPGSGFSSQLVKSDLGNFLVNIVAADLSSTRVVIDTASDGDCHDNCPVLALSDYVSRSSAFAGVNGAYFCPASYPSCSGKTNSFDTLLMNKNKVYFNSDNNVYSVVPVVAVYGTTARFMEKSLEWGRDTGVDAVIANYPLLVLNGEIKTYGGDDPKINSKGTRAFIGGTGSTIYIGVVFNASVNEMAHTLKTLGINNALNLDDGGSIALWAGGNYRAGPGRNIPNAVLFVRK